MPSFGDTFKRNVDKVNLVLILVSVVVAIYLPFELFLFSYAILGPLHYLTEISWLHQRKYFLEVPKTSQKILFPILVGILAIVIAFTNKQTLNGLRSDISITNITLFVFFLSAILIIFKRTDIRVGAIAILAIICFFVNMESGTLTYTDRVSGQLTTVETNGQLSDIREKIVGHCRDVNGDNNITQNVDFTFNRSFPFWVMLFGTYIPTLVHVYIFTLLFMLYGALKNNSLYGKLAVAVLFLAAIFLLLVPLRVPYKISDYAFTIYDGTFANVNKAFISDFNYGKIADKIYSSTNGLMLARFIAFAYTYHYLNWFSKTSLIQWHKMPKLNLAVVVVLWIGSIALYLADFKLGFIVLLFLSFMHVFLEFPLNVQSIRGIWQHFSDKIIPRNPKTGKTPITR